MTVFLLVVIELTRLILVIQKNFDKHTPVVYFLTPFILIVTYVCMI